MRFIKKILIIIYLYDRLKSMDINKYNQLSLNGNRGQRVLLNDPNIDHRHILTTFIIELNLILK